MPAPLTLLLLGATGAVGSQTLRLALADPRIARVVAPTRRPLPAHPKLANPVGESIADAAIPDGIDAAICALGSTIRKAGSREAFAAIDRDLPVALASRAKAAGAHSFVLNSSLGASLSGSFYLRTKAEAEAGIRALGIKSFTIVRPSLIETRRAEPRLAETVGLAVARLLAVLIPRRYRPVSAEAIAATMLEAAISARPGETVIESEAIRPPQG
ncbi:NAD(P)H-binding protein [Niveibacterium terrae]|uniref:NAD(P)H-binding protein n=1 Tax=Niveibacterium terrae TaxID=3373598 RepID=UPI003A8F9CDD